MEVAAGSRYAPVAKGGLYERDRCATVEGATGVRVAQPVRAHLSGKARTLRRLFERTPRFVAAE